MDSQSKVTLIKNLIREVGENPDDFDINAQDRVSFVKKKNSQKATQILDSELEDENFLNIKMRLKNLFRNS